MGSEGGKSLVQVDTICWWQSRDLNPVVCALSPAGLIGGMKTPRQESAWSLCRIQG